VSLETIVVRPHHVDPAALPRSAKSAHKRLLQAGRMVICWAGTAHEADRKHLGPDGEPDRLAEYVDKEPLPSEDGKPILTPTGKVAMREVPTGVLVTYDWVSLYVGIPLTSEKIAATPLGWGTWERDHRAGTWKAREGYVYGADMPRMGITEWEAAMVA